jgi:hypothetical protein
MMKWVFGADTTPFRRGLDDMRTQTKAFSGGVRSMLMRAFGVGVIIAGFRNLFTEMDRVHKLAIRFGESAETIQKVSHAAELAGTDMEGLAKAMSIVTRNASKAAREGGAMGESFARVGINASEFVNLPLEQKILLLSKAFTEGQGTGTKLADMMEVLGRSGDDLIPLLSQGMEELQGQLDKTSTVSQSTVNSIAQFNDAMISMKQKAQVVGAGIVDAFKMAGASLEWLLNLMNGKEFADAQFDKRMDAIVAGGHSKPAGPNVEEVVEAAREAIRAQEEAKRLAEQIAKLQEDAKMRELTLAEQILEIEKKRAGVLDGIYSAETENEGLAKQKELLEINKELADLKKKQDEESAKAADEIAKATADMTKKLAEAATREAEVDRENRMRGMSDEERLDVLKSERDDLFRQSKEAGKAGQLEEEINLRTAAKSKEGEIAELMEQIAGSSSPSSPTIAAGSLASIGAGGSANLLTTDTTEQRKISLLEVIANNTGRSETGGANIPEPI